MSSLTQRLDRFSSIKLEDTQIKLALILGAVVVTIGVIGLALSTGLGVLERLLMPWAARGGSQ